MKRVMIINGPNLNMIGEREPHHYGVLTLDQIKEYTQQKISENKYSLELTWFQSNIEGEIVSEIQKLLNARYDALVINPGGYSHTSVAIHDAMKIINIPIVEVHLSNVYHRESFRQTMLTAQAASIIMSGLGRDAYYISMQALMNIKKG